MALRDKVLAFLPGRKSAPGPSASAAPLAKPSAAVTVRKDDPAWSQTPYKPVPRSVRAGSAGTAMFWGRIRYEEFNAALENEKGYGKYSAQGVYDLMRKTDGQVRRSLEMLKQPILGAKWIFEPADDTDEAKEHAAFASYCLFERLKWDQILEEALTMLDFGFSLFELVEDTVDVPRRRFPGIDPTVTGDDPAGPGRPAKGSTVTAVVPVAIESRPAKTIYRWKANPDNPLAVDAVQQILPVDDNNTEVFRLIPGDRLLRFTFRQEGQNFQGVSLLRTAYKPWLIMDQLQRLDAIRHERQNVGIPVIKLPPETAGSTDKDAEAKADEILSHLASHEQGYVTLPPGWELSWLTTTKGEGTDVNEAIERCKREIADNVLIGFMTLGNGDTGSYALAETQADQYLLQLESLARKIEDVWNKGADGWSPIKRLIDANYGPQESYPRLKAAKLRTRDNDLQTVAEMIRYGAIKPDAGLDNFFRSRFDLPANLAEAEAEVDDVGDTDDDDEAANPDQADMTPAEEAAPLPPPPPPTTSRGTGTPAPAPAPTPASARAKAQKTKARRAMEVAARVYAEMMRDANA